MQVMRYAWSDVTAYPTHLVMRSDIVGCNHHAWLPDVNFRWGDPPDGRGVDVRGLLYCVWGRFYLIGLTNFERKVVAALDWTCATRTPGWTRRELGG